MRYRAPKQISKTQCHVFLSSVLMSFYLSIANINAILVHIVENIGPFSTMEMLYFFAVLFIGIIICLEQSFLKVKVQVVGICVVLIIYYIVVSFSSVESSIKPAYFILYVIAPLLLSYYLRIDTRLFLKSAMVFPLFGVFFLDEIFVRHIYNNNITMGMSYAFLFPIIATIVYCHQYFKCESRLQKCVTVLAAGVNFVYFMQLLLYGSRGPLLSIVVCICFLVFVQFYNEDQGGFRIFSYKLCVVGIIGCIVLLNIWNILNAINDLLIEWQISARFVTKLISLGAEDNVLNGRSELYEMTIDGILKSPIWGNGICSFTYNTGEVYPHNFLLQMLYDGGIVLFCYLVIPVCIAFKRWSKFCTKDSFALVITVVMASVPGALFSNDLWKLPILWYSMGLILNHSHKNAMKKYCFRYKKCK